jgi:hypothetical protein
MKFFHPGYAILFSTLLLVFAVYTLQKRSDNYSYTEPPKVGIEENLNTSNNRSIEKDKPVKPETATATPTPLSIVKKIEYPGQFIKITKGYKDQITQVYFIKIDAIISLEVFKDECNCGRQGVHITTNELIMEQDASVNKVYCLPFKSMKEANSVAATIIRIFQRDEKKN